MKTEEKQNDLVDPTFRKTSKRDRKKIVLRKNTLPKALAKRLAKINPDYKDYEYEDLLHTLSEGVVELMLEGRDVELKGLGKFCVRKKRDGYSGYTKRHFIGELTPHFELSRHFLFVMRPELNPQVKERFEQVAAEKELESENQNRDNEKTTLDIEGFEIK